MVHAACTTPWGCASAAIRRCAPSRCRRPAHRQLVLFEAVRTLAHRGTEGLARRADAHLAAWVEQFTREGAIRYTWSRDLTWRVRTGVNITLGFIDTPGAALSLAFNLACHSTC
ncbi:hypothetical protein [Streptomyces sp. NPDC001292]|uniref:hypothetical protein n=1 Tax=Streptomyces sp. NPDC001292 TaxID=3364558 RepID=UPI0036AB1A7F